MAAHFITGAGPLAVGASTMFFGALLLLVASPRQSALVFRDRSSKTWLLLGGAGMVVYPLAFYSGMSLAGVAIGNAVALGSGPVFAVLLELIISKSRPTQRTIVAMGIALCGVALLGSMGATSQGSDAVAGVFLALLAGLGYATFTFSATRLAARGLPSRGVMAATFGTAAVGLLPVLLVTGAPLLESANNVALSTYLAVGPMFVAYLFFGIGIRVLSSSTVTTVTLLEPVGAGVLAAILLGERIGVLGWLALVLVGVGVTVLATARQVGETINRP